MIVIKNNQVYSDEGKYVHKIGTDTYVKKSMVLPTDKVEDFEEVSELPLFTKEQYDNKVAELIREKYSASEEFALQRKMINATNADMPLSDAETNRVIEEYDTYNTYVEECKIKAKNPDLYKHNYPLA